MLGDEIALKKLLNCKGATAQFLCPQCANLVPVTSRLLSPSWLVPLTCTDTSKLVAQTIEGVIAALTRLRAQRATMASTPFDELERYVGWVFDTFSIITDAPYPCKS